MQNVGKFDSKNETKIKAILTKSNASTAKKNSPSQKNMSPKNSNLASSNSTPSSSDSEKDNDNTTEVDETPSESDEESVSESEILLACLCLRPDLLAGLEYDNEVEEEQDGEEDDVDDEDEDEDEDDEDEDEESPTPTFMLELDSEGRPAEIDTRAFEAILADKKKPEVLQQATMALDEAAKALKKMRPDNNPRDKKILRGFSIFSRTLIEACNENDVNAVRRILGDGPTAINEATDDGESLLSLACSAGYYELAQVLLAMSAQVEDRGQKNDCTPLMEAASAGHEDIIRLLISHGADVNATSSSNNTPLMYACAGGHVEAVKVLLEAGANVEDHNENGHTPLMEAASSGHVEVARVLLAHGAGINAHSNEFKESALTLACYKGHLDMVRFLLEAGADQEHKTDEMHTALMEASMDGHVEVARLLLDSGAQVNMPTDSFESPLTLAACGGHRDLAMLLIERGANIEEVNDEGYTPLMEAAREGHEEMVSLLISQGAKVNAQTEETQETALTLTCCGGFQEVADFLIRNGADIELGASTPLMEAAQEGHLELVKFLLENGANYMAHTQTGDTALTLACENGHTDVAELLLSYGADLEHESEGGRTPLMKACRAGHICTIKFLISKGADVNRQTTSNDHTPLSLACAGGHLAVVELLLKSGADPYHKLKDNSTMVIEASKGGHTGVVQLLFDYPHSMLASPNSALNTSDQLLTNSPIAGQIQYAPIQQQNMMMPQHTSQLATPPPGLHEVIDPLRTTNQNIYQQLATNDQEAVDHAQQYLHKIQSDSGRGDLLTRMQWFSEGYKAGVDIHRSKGNQVKCLPPKLNNLAPNKLQQKIEEANTPKLVKQSLRKLIMDARNKPPAPFEIPASEGPTSPSRSQPVGEDRDGNAISLLSLPTNAEDQVLHQKKILAEFQKLDNLIPQNTNLPSYRNTPTSGSSFVDLSNNATSGIFCGGVGTGFNFTATNGTSLLGAMPIGASPILSAALATLVTGNQTNDGNFSLVAPSSTVPFVTKILSPSVTTSATSNLTAADVSPSTAIGDRPKAKPVSKKDSKHVRKAALMFQQMQHCKQQQQLQQQILQTDPQLKQNFLASEPNLRLLHQSLANLNVTPSQSSFVQLPEAGNEIASPTVTEGEASDTDNNRSKSEQSAEKILLTNSEIAASFINNLPSLGDNNQTHFEKKALFERFSKLLNEIPTPQALKRPADSICDDSDSIGDSNLPSMDIKAESSNIITKSDGSQVYSESQIADMSKVFLTEMMEEINFMPSINPSDGDIHFMDSKFTDNFLQQSLINKQRDLENVYCLNNQTVGDTLEQCIDLNKTFQVENFDPTQVDQGDDPNNELIDLIQVDEVFNNMFNGVTLQEMPPNFTCTEDFENLISINALCKARWTGEWPQGNISNVQSPNGNLNVENISSDDQQNDNQMTLDYHFQQKLTPDQIALLNNLQNHQQQLGGISLLPGAAGDQQSQLAFNQLQPISANTATGTTDMQPPVQLLFQLPSTVQQQQSSSQQQPVQIQPVGQLIEPKDPKSEPPQTSILSVVQTPIQLGLIEQQNVQMHGPNGNGGLQGLHANQLQNVNFQDTQQDTAFYPDRHHHFPAVGHPHYIQNNSQQVQVATQTPAMVGQDLYSRVPDTSSHVGPIKGSGKKACDRASRKKVYPLPTIPIPTNTTHPQFPAVSNGLCPVIPIDKTIEVDTATESNHDTALTFACNGGHAELAELLINRGANIEHRDKKGLTPLALAASGGFDKVVKILLNHKAQIEAQSERTKDTPLSLACSGGRQEVAEILLEHNANKEHRNVSDYTPLSLAASGGYVNIIKLLLHFGAEINSRTGSKLGISPLMLAAMNGHTAAVKLLLDKGSDINAQIETNRNTALTLACFQGRHEVVSLLLDRKANIEHRAKTGLTPLMEAASGGYIEVGRVLLEKGADVNAAPVPSSRDTALTIAADKGHQKFVELLLSKGAAVEVKNKKGNSPLWLAANGGHLGVVELLYQHDADIDSQDNRKCSCLMAAFRKGHLKVVKWMVDHVKQFPSDVEMNRFINTVSDKELLDKCNACMIEIRAAKEAQAERANKFATSLLEELYIERTREENRKAAQARRRERKKQRKLMKKDQKKLMENQNENDGDGNQDEDTQASEKESDKDNDDDDEISIEPQPKANKSNGQKQKGKSQPVNQPSVDKEECGDSGIDANSQGSCSSADAVKAANERSKNNNKQKKQKEKNSTTVVELKTNAKQTKKETEPKNAKAKTPQPPKADVSKQKETKPTSTVTSKDIVDNKKSNAKVTKEKENVAPKEEQSKPTGKPDKKTERQQSIQKTGTNQNTSTAEVRPENTNTSNNKSQVFCAANQSGQNSRTTKTGNESVISEEVTQSAEITSAKTKLNNKNHSASNDENRLGAKANNSNHQKREEGWKEVVRKNTPVTTPSAVSEISCKKVVVPAHAISRVIGRQGSNINAIRAATGAHIEVEKQGKNQSDRAITIRGTNEAVKQAHMSIATLVKDPEVDILQTLTKSNVKPTANITLNPTFNNSTPIAQAITTNAPSINTFTATAKPTKATNPQMFSTQNMNVQDSAMIYTASKSNVRAKPTYSSPISQTRTVSNSNVKINSQNMPPRGAGVVEKRPTSSSWYETSNVIKSKPSAIVNMSSGPPGTYASKPSVAPIGAEKKNLQASANNSPKRMTLSTDSAYSNTSHGNNKHTIETSTSDNGPNNGPINPIGSNKCSIGYQAEATRSAPVTSMSRPITPIGGGNRNMIPSPVAMGYHHVPPNENYSSGLNLQMPCKLNMNNRSEYSLFTNYKWDESKVIPFTSGEPKSFRLETDPMLKVDASKAPGYRGSAISCSPVSSKSSSNPTTSPSSVPPPLIVPISSQSTHLGHPNLLSGMMGSDDYLLNMAISSGSGVPTSNAAAAVQPPMPVSNLTIQRPNMNQNMQQSQSMNSPMDSFGNLNRDMYMENALHNNYSNVNDQMNSMNYSLSHSSFGLNPSSNQLLNQKSPSNYLSGPQAHNQPQTTVSNDLNSMHQRNVFHNPMKSTYHKMGMNYNSLSSTSQMAPSFIQPSSGIKNRPHSQPPPMSNNRWMFDSMPSHQESYPVDYEVAGLKMNTGSSPAMSPNNNQRNSINGVMAPPASTSSLITDESRKIPRPIGTERASMKFQQFGHAAGTGPMSSHEADSVNQNRIPPNRWGFENSGKSQQQPPMASLSWNRSSDINLQFADLMKEGVPGQQDMGQNQVHMLGQQPNMNYMQQYPNFMNSIQPSYNLPGNEWDPDKQARH